MKKPRLLDLFCGAGGCSVGYHRAGFDVVGVDINPQPHYPFEFYQYDALRFPFHGFDVIHASPPCQAHTKLQSISKVKHHHVDHISAIRMRFIESGKPYVIENVSGAPLLDAVTLCGTMFGLGVIRHRLFECFPNLLTPPPQCNHSGTLYTVLTKSCRVSGDLRGKSSHATGMVAMGINWMTQQELGEAIPPAYTEWIGTQLRAHVLCAEAAAGQGEARFTACNTPNMQLAEPAVE